MEDVRGSFSAINDTNILTCIRRALIICTVQLLCPVVKYYKGWLVKVMLLHHQLHTASSYRHIAFDMLDYTAVVVVCAVQNVAFM